jgi:hypothetical protein
MLRSILFQADLAVHHDVLPCRGRDLTEEEVDCSFSPPSLRRSQLRRCGAAVAVVAVAVTAVLWGGVAWFACGDGVLWGMGWGGGGVDGGGGGGGGE